MKTTSRKPWCEKGLRISRQPNRPITTTPGACCCSPQNCPRDANWRLPLLRLEVLWKHVCFLGFHIDGKISRKSFVSKHEWKTRGFGSCWSENGVLPYENTSNLQFLSGKNDGKPLVFEVRHVWTEMTSPTDFHFLHFFGSMISGVMLIWVSKNSNQWTHGDAAAASCQ